MSLTESNPTAVDVSRSGIAEKRIDVITNHRALFSKKLFNSGDIIVPFNAKAIHQTPSYLTIQIGETEHIELLPEYLDCVNHSCDPNSFFDTTRWQLVALKRIEAGEEITFFYPSTEWDMDQAFQCNCRNQNCIGMIKGAKYLDSSVTKQYRFTDFIQHKLATKAR